MVKVIDVVQGTQEWHEWRRGGVGASDVAAIFGKSPYKTKRDLWFEKSGFGEPEDEDRSYIFRKGHEAESEFRELFIQKTGIEIVPACLEKDVIFRSSLDGYKKSVVVVEAKLVSKEVLKRAHETNEIPEHHRIQIQAQLHGSDEDKAYWGGKAPGIKEGVVIPIGRDKKLITKITSEVKEFWESLSADEPPPLTSQDTMFIHEPEKVALFKKFRELKLKKNEIEAAYSEVEEAVKALATHSKVKCEGVTITEVERAGSIDYLKIPEVKALAQDYIEKYRKRASVYKMIKVSGA